MGVTDTYRIQYGEAWTAFRRRFRVSLLKLTPSRKLSPIQKFLRDGFNSKIFSSVPSDEVSQVLVFGGYKGDSVDGWLNKNPRARIQTYEPVRDYAAILENRFHGSDVAVHSFGVGKRSGTRTFSVMSDATSGHPGITGAPSISPPATIDVWFESVAAAGKDWPDRIDVAEINIEGGEYELIPALAEAGKLAQIKHIFVQFHDVGHETTSFVEESRNHLAESHLQVWCYDMVWEYWKLSEPS
ncbi:hypothetical protein H7J51_10420 [Mycobacterium crocinum]|uniref:Methyltransferase FkbM domain-containing protein n=1 Tax=Mycolicibacterium crocinum TaxID=388459 RepID=A0ABY3TNM1_9MYCO|nr:hypothetical protein [Mycolicibacterium crocinum]MCV7215698.1 hypothetical protein [Mycolicibacterium crocinum]ULN42565.1 hypothetical protein MI149_05480 [Mycolicibacterium crocinum]